MVYLQVISDLTVNPLSNHYLEQNVGRNLTRQDVLFSTHLHLSDERGGLSLEPPLDGGRGRRSSLLDHSTKYRCIPDLRENNFFVLSDPFRPNIQTDPFKTTIPPLDRYVSSHTQPFPLYYAHESSGL